MKGKPLLSSIIVLNLAQSWSLWNLESMRFYSHLQTRAAKWCLIASLVAGQTHARQSASGTPHQGSETQCNGFMHRSSSSTQPRAKGQRLASPRKPNRLNTKYKDCAILLGARSPSALASPLQCATQPSSPSHLHILHLRGVACSLGTQEGGASACSANF